MTKKFHISCILIRYETSDETNELLRPQLDHQHSISDPSPDKLELLDHFTAPEPTKTRFSGGQRKELHNTRFMYDFLYRLMEWRGPVRRRPENNVLQYQ
jgi:hypothetical protein